MRLRTTFWLLVAVAAMAAVIWYVDHAPRRRPAPAGGPLLTRTADRVERLSLVRPEGRITCERVKGDWRLAYPVAARAYAVEMDRILAVLGGLRREEIVSESERVNRGLTLADYGLDAPRVKIVLAGPLGSEEIWVGHDAPLDRRVYVKVADEKAVIATGRSIRSVLMDKAQQLRDRRVFFGQPGETVRFGIKRRQHGFVQVAHTPTGWVVQQPLPSPARADEGQVMALLGGLFALRVKQFVWDPPVDDGRGASTAAEDLGGQAKVETYRLAEDEAVASVTLWLESEEVGRELLIGKAVEAEGRHEVFARIEGVDSVFTLDKRVVDLLTVDLNQLRDRRVFALEAGEVQGLALTCGDERLQLASDPAAGWMIRDPVQWRADGELVATIVKRLVGLEIKSFVADVTPDKLADMGLVPPACTITLNPAPESSAPGEARPERPAMQGDRLHPAPLEIGNVTDEQKSCFVRFRSGAGSVDSSVFEVAAGDVRSFVPLEEPCNPLQYRDRTMLALPIDTVRRVTLTRKGRTQTAQRGETGEWEAASPTNSVDREGLGNLLYFASNLRAVRVEALNPRTLVPYGLDAPEVSLTFGLTGEAGIRKTLLFGHRARTTGIFAMVQGQDVVFVLDRSLVEVATRDLIRPVESGKQEASP